MKNYNTDRAFGIHICCVCMIYSYSNSELIRTTSNLNLIGCIEMLK